MTHRPLRLAYYADDFTGATDALEQLHRGGERGMLHLDAPADDLSFEASETIAIGVAGRSRSLRTESLAGEITPVFERFRRLAPRHVHYKVCSTFDSSPEIGSIGRVIEIGLECFGAPFVPVVAASPALGRWCVFGNLFASYGVGEATPAYRLDRHPSASRHPITPASESDLRRVLAEQTSRSIGLIDVRDLAGTPERAIKIVDRTLQGTGAEVLLFDCLDASHLGVIGVILEHYAERYRTLFTVGSSGVETALVAAWGSTGVGSAPREPVPPGPALILSGSCSPVTLDQLQTAAAAGLEVLHLPPDQPSLAPSIAERVADSLARGRSVAVASRELRGGASTNARIDAADLGGTLAAVWKACRKATPIGLTVVAGGDTSSYVARGLGVTRLGIWAPLATGAPVCLVRSSEPLVDSSLFVFKGGQVGGPRLFADLISGN